MDNGVGADREKGGSTSWSTTWRTCGSTWWTWRIELSGGEPVWLTPHPRDLIQPGGERDCRRKVRLSHFSATVSLFATVWTGLNAVRSAIWAAAELLFHCRGCDVCCGCWLSQLISSKCCFVEADDSDNQWRHHWSSSSSSSSSAAAATPCCHVTSHSTPPTCPVSLLFSLATY